jgi:hypothetical protein
VRRSALSPGALGGAHDGGSTLPPAAVDAVHRIASDPGRLTRSWYDALLADGLSPEQLVELTGLIGILTIGDTLARACDAPLAELPAPSDGPPTRQRPDGTRIDEAWVPMIPSDRAEGAIAAMYAQVQRAAGFVFNVARALTLVPAELMGFFGVFLHSYSTHGAPPAGGLTRPQMELLAATTSSLNDCFS